MKYDIGIYLTGKMLLETFETQYAAVNLQIELSLINTGRNETIIEYNMRVEHNSKIMQLTIMKTFREQAIVS